MLRNPVLLAHQVATLDQIAEGRMILGVGTARDVPAIRNEFEAAGVPFEKRIGRMLEQMRLCRELWKGEPVDWEGLWTVKQGELAPVPYTKGGPAIWSGGGVEAALKRAGRYFNGWFPSGAGTGKALDRRLERCTAVWKKLVGIRQTSSSTYVTISVNDDQTKADAELDAYLGDITCVPPTRSYPAIYLCRQPRRRRGLAQRTAAGGASHMCVRFTGSNDAAQMEELIRSGKSWAGPRPYSVVRQSFRSSARSYRQNCRRCGAGCISYKSAVPSD